jgi:glutathione S-transferase
LTLFDQTLPICHLSSPSTPTVAQVSTQPSSLRIASTPLDAHLSHSSRFTGPNPLKVAILLEYLGLSYDVKALDFGDDPEKGVKGAAFMKVNPNGRVPALVDHQNKDLVIWESGAILYYLVDKYDTKGLFLGHTPEERAETMIWLTHQLSGLGPAQGNL